VVFAVLLSSLTHILAVTAVEFCPVRNVLEDAEEVTLLSALTVGEHIERIAVLLLVPLQQRERGVR